MMLTRRAGAGTEYEYQALRDRILVEDAARGTMTQRLLTTVRPRAVHSPVFLGDVIQIRVTSRGCSALPGPEPGGA